AAAGDRSGTPLYLAPEVLDGDPASARSDIYSVGVLLYYLVTGDFPVRGQTVEEIAGAHQRGVRVPLLDTRADMPAWYASGVDRGLAVVPRSRYDSAGALASALAEMAAGDAAHTRLNPSLIATGITRRTAPRWPSRRAGIGAVVLMSLGALFGIWKWRT